MLKGISVDRKLNYLIFIGKQGYICISNGWILQTFRVYSTFIHILLVIFLTTSCNPNNKNGHNEYKNKATTPLITYTAINTKGYDWINVTGKKHIHRRPECKTIYLSQRSSWEQCIWKMSTEIPNDIILHTKWMKLETYNSIK